MPEPKKKPGFAYKRLKKYEGMSREELLTLRNKLAAKMPADDDPEIFTAFSDVSSLL